jgi:xylono-1,5-lactonase
MNVINKEFTVRCVTKGIHNTLGEGPIWDHKNNVLYWVDILANNIFRLEPISGKVTIWHTSEYVGFIVPCEDGSFIAGYHSGLFSILLHENGEITETCIDPINKNNSNIRFNDGCCDPMGNLWACTMDMACKQPLGKYYFYNAALQRYEVDHNYIVANGPSLSVDGKKVYTVETIGSNAVAKAIYVASINGTQLTTDKKVLINWTFDDLPDGIITDAAGNLWVGVFGGYALRCFAANGTLLGEIELPAKNITKCAFGGPNLDVLYVTTARVFCSDEDLEKYPETGNVFEISGKTLKGIATNFFKNNASLK